MRSKRVLKWIGCGLLAGLVLALVLVAGGWLLLCASLAELDGRLAITGLSAPVTSANALLTVKASPRVMRTASREAATVRTIDLPAELVSFGDENSVGFSSK